VPDRDSELPAPLGTLFAERGWTPFAFQRRAWRAYLEGRSGLINAPTGVGKTLAAWLGPVIERLIGGVDGAGGGSGEAKPARRSRVSREHYGAEPARVVWLTPLRALASDTAHALLDPVQRLGLAWTVQVRTGDTAQSVRLRQKDRLPTALVTTPESLTLLLSYPDAAEKFATLRCVVVDEWHELLSTKRGVQVELALARLRRLAPGLRTWGVSATLGNLAQARDVLLGPGHDPGQAELIRGEERKDLRIETLVPEDIARFPWAGHLGIQSAPAVIERIRAARTTLLFTNTRSQAELWFRRLLHDAPDLLGAVAIHHGSLDRKLRAQVEGLLADGRLRCVVCTSSLDLGVDFAPVDQVLQVGSPKGVGRMVQRAGRSGHRPGAESRMLGVPTHAFELVEFAAAREAAAAGEIESREPVERPLDVLAQHLVTMACAGGFVEAEMEAEVRSTHAFASLNARDWAWVMDFVTRGGDALKAYPDFARVRLNPATGRHEASSTIAARVHRASIGTISAESVVSVKYVSGKTLGHVEEDFVGRLSPGQRFVFAGKVLEVLRTRGMAVFVRPTRSKSGIVPRWQGSRFSLSTRLAAGVRRALTRAKAGDFSGPEMSCVRPLLELQTRWSAIPAEDELLIETLHEAGVHHAFVFPFHGRMAHEGLGSLLAYRLSRRAPMTITAVANDYGIALRSADPIELSADEWRALLEPADLAAELMECLNSANLARRSFRDIARIAGLIQPGFRGADKPMRHVQASSEMFFDVFSEFDPGNLLLEQARREVLEGQLDLGRLRRALDGTRGQRIVMLRPPAYTPLAFPLWAEHLRATTLSTEKWADMVQTMALRLEARADAEGASAGTQRTRGGARERGRGPARGRGSRPSMG
jgi:ATP-dependent Lhr-like helicase